MPKGGNSSSKETNGSSNNNNASQQTMGHGDQSLVVHVGSLELLCQNLPRPRLLPSAEPGSLVDSVASAAAQYYMTDDNIYLSFQPYTAAASDPNTAQGTTTTNQPAVETVVKTLPKNMKTVEFNCDVALSLPASLGDVRQFRVCLYRRGIIDNELLADALVEIPITTEVSESNIIMVSRSDGTPMVRVTLSIQLVVTERLIMVHFAEELRKLVTAQTLSSGKDDNGSPAERSRDTVEAIQRYVYACSAIRHLWHFVYDILTWKSGYTRTWLFLIAIVYSEYLWLVFLLLCCHIVLSASSTSEFTSPDEVDANLAFVKQQADGLSYISELLATRVSYRVGMLVCACVLFLTPRPHVTVCVIIILCRTYWAQALYQTIRCRRETKRRKGSMMFTSAASSQDCAPGNRAITVEVYENQRWWVGKWSDNLLAVERYAWSDEAGTSRRTKEDVHLPPPVGDNIWQWSSLWRVDARPETHETDADGWTYARDFGSGQWSATRGMGDFVRRRRWTRTARLVAVNSTHNSEGDGNGNTAGDEGVRQRPQKSVEAAPLEVALPSRQKVSKLKCSSSPWRAAEVVHAIGATATGIEAGLETAGADLGIGRDETTAEVYSRRSSDSGDVDELRRRIRRLEEVNKQLRSENLELMRQLVAIKEKGGQQETATPERSSSPRGGPQPTESKKENEPNGDEQMTMTFNCCQLVNFSGEVFNQKIPNNVPIEHRGKSLGFRHDEFFAKDAMVIDANTKKPILEDLRDIRTRYQTVFRESGSDLEIKTLRRWYFEADKEGDTEYCIDFEQHLHIVSPRPGLRLDGALGVVGPRDVDLITLYKSSHGKIDCMWLLPDKNRIGQDKILGQADLEESQAYESLLAIIKEDAKKHKSAVPTKVHYYDYNKVETIG
ncbi:hypothetical protein FOL47_007710 [Perkinsus chesapeaki]|uniref:Peroxin/Ferlin domain-containing protein n=1 Tax=Perkinsus chesapeaki TaxID=330153 RepID=A0A7J6LJE7_PERCH|nr:hypothetical protein FOL47_007710 [Perkinsus chesapeaki]